MGNTTMKSEEKKQMEFVLLLVLHLVAVCGERPFNFVGEATNCRFHVFGSKGWRH